MRRTTMCTILAAALLLPCGAAAAQASPPAAGPSDNQDIVVHGVNRHRQVSTFVQQLTPALTGAQLPAFSSPVCPVVLGMPAANNALVEARIRRVAAAIGSDVGKAGCVPNLYVLVGPAKADTIAGIRRQFPHLVAGVPPSLMRRLAKAPGPVAAWQVVDEIGSDGVPFASVRTSDGSEAVRMISTVGTPSRLRLLARPFVVGSVLVVEAKALDGVTTRQLADYAVMRTLAPTDTTRQTALPADSIIKLFDPGAVPADAPPSVTWWDVAFLKALYQSNNDVVASTQRGQIQRRMEKELNAAPLERR